MGAMNTINIASHGIMIAVALLLAVPGTGQINFIRTYGLNTVHDEGRCVIEAVDGGYYVAGLDVFEDSTFMFAGSGVLLRTNAVGDELWRQEYSVPGAQSVQIEDMIATTDGNLVVAGLVDQGVDDYDVYLAKIDTAGNAIWSAIIARPYKQWAYQVRETPDHGFIAAGWTSTTPWVNSGAFYLVRLDSNGDTLWTRTHPSPYPWDQLAYCVEVMPDSGFVVAGKQMYGGVGYNHVMRMNAVGDTLWTKTLDSLAQGEARDVAITDDGNIVVTGFSGVTGFSEPFLAELDPNGNMLWSRIYDEVVAGWSYSVAKTASGFALLVQDYMYDVILLDVELNGDLNWLQHYDVALDYPYSVEPTADGGFVMTGATTPGGVLASDIFLIKTDGSGIVSAMNDEDGKPDGMGLVAYPNPAERTATIVFALREPGSVSIRLLDLTGREVLSILSNDFRSTGQQYETIDLSTLAAGTYVIELGTGSGRTSLRLIKR